jgi:hypothetical protein
LRPTSTNQFRFFCGYAAAIEQQDAVLIEVLERAWRAKALQIPRRRIGMKMHGEQLALDYVRLRRLPHSNTNVGLAHGEVELFVGDDEINADIRIKLHEFAEPWNEPVHAKTRRGGHLEVAVRPLAAVGQLGPRRFEFHENVMRGTIEKLPLLRQDETAGMAVKQCDREFLLECADLP